MDTVLIFGGSLASFGAFGEARRMGDGEVHLTLAGDGATRREFAILVERDVGRALRRLSARAVDVTVIDARGVEAPGDQERCCRCFSSGCFRDTKWVARRVRQRTVVLVDGNETGARLAFLAGTHRVASVDGRRGRRRHHRASGVHDLPVDPLTARWRSAWRAVGSKGSCTKWASSARSTTFFEDRKLRRPGHVLRHQRRCHVERIARERHGSQWPSPRVSNAGPISSTASRAGTSSILQRGRGFGMRVLGFFRDVVGLGEARNPISALYRAIPSAAFAGDALKRIPPAAVQPPEHERQLRRSAAPALHWRHGSRHQCEAVVFGEPGWRDVPIHKAVRASCALAPFFRPEKVGGRYYIDGAFTRTTNVRVAVKHGASLVIIVDPLVPILLRKSLGTFASAAACLAPCRDSRGLINGRFDKALASIREMYPEVAFHLFRPEGDEMRILSGSPMKFLYREEIEELAYQRTLRKIRASMSEMSRDFSRHGIVFREPPGRSRLDTPYDVLSAT